MDIINSMDTNKEKLSRFIADQFSFNDYLSVSSFFKKEEHQSWLTTHMESGWNETDQTLPEKVRLDQILDQLHDQINSRDHDKPHTQSSFYRLFSKVAAVLILPALLTIAVLSYLTVRNAEKTESWAEIHSPVGSRTKFQLPDGSQGWLNSGSSIKYPISFLRQRHVEISGEAWLDVVPMESKDFRVITPYFDVKVMGTQFNVIAYENESMAEVLLESGKVLVLGKDETVKGELIPDQQLVFNKATKEFIKTSVDSKSYTRWKDGILVFRNVPMAEMVRRLERKYNTEIILHGDELASSIFRATFQDESLDEICKMLSTVAPIAYKIHPWEKQADNTLAKGKVEMWLKNKIKKMPMTE